MTPVTPSVPRTPPAGVVFDCDGVLVDSEPLHAAATTEWAASIGIDLPPETFDDLVGLTVPQQIERVLEGTPHSREHGYIARERFFWRRSTELTALDGVVTLIRRLHDAHVLVAVCSNGSRRYVDHVVDTLRLRPLIEGLICADDVRHPKPHPEPYLRAARLLGLAPEDCYAVEDSGPGATSALAAGMSVIRIGATAPDRAVTGPLSFAPDIHGAAALLLPG